MFPLIAMAAKFLMPMVTKMAGSLMSGGLSGILGKLGNFGDLLGGLFEKNKEARQESNAKMEKAKDANLAAQRQEDSFMSRVTTNVTQVAAQSAFSVV